MWSLLVIMTHNSKLSYQSGTGSKLDSEMKWNVITITISKKCAWMKYQMAEVDIK